MCPSEGHGTQINQSKFYSPYSQITVRLIELNMVWHRLSLTLSKSEENLPRNLTERHMWAIPLPGPTEVH